MDRRQRRTRKAIFDAFEELAEQRHYAAITVGQIIERADIGRSTFYAHFGTKDELLDQMCHELFAHVFEGVEDSAHTHDSLQEPTLTGTLSHLLHHLHEDHSGIGGKLLAEGEPHFSAYFRAQLATFFANCLPEHCSWVPRDLLLSLVVGGFCQVVSWWHEQGYLATPEELAHWYLRTFGWQTTARTERHICE